MENSKILIRNAAQIVTCHGDKARRGAEMSDLGVIEDGAVAMSDGGYYACRTYGGGTSKHPCGGLFGDSGGEPSGVTRICR